MRRWTHRIWAIWSQPVFGPMLRQRSGCLIVSVGMAVIAAMGYFGHSPMPCPALTYGDVPCPGCGLTRSVNAVVTGDVQGIWHFHVFGPFLLFIGALFLLGSILPGRLRGELSERVTLFERRTGICGFALLLLWVYWVARLLDFWGGVDALYVT